MTNESPFTSTAEPITSQERRALQRRAMAGYDPSQEEQAALDADMARLEGNAENLGSFGMAGAGLTGMAAFPAAAGALGLGSMALDMVKGTPVNAVEGDNDPVAKAVASHPEAQSLQTQIMEISKSISALHGERAAKATANIPGIKDIKSADASRERAKTVIGEQIASQEAERSRLQTKFDAIALRVGGEAAKKQREAMTVAQQYPQEMQWASAAGLIAGGGIGAAVTGRLAKQGQMNVKAIEEELKKALEKGNTQLATHLNAALVKATKTQSPSLVPGTASGVVGGEVVPAIGGTMDFNSGNKTREDSAKDGFRSVGGFAERYGAPAMAGGLAGFAGSKIASASMKYTPRSYSGETGAANGMQAPIPSQGWPSVPDTLQESMRRMAAIRLGPKPGQNPPRATHTTDAEAAPVAPTQERILGPGATPTSDNKQPGNSWSAPSAYNRQEHGGAADDAVRASLRGAGGDPSRLDAKHLAEDVKRRSHLDGKVISDDVTGRAEKTTQRSRDAMNAGHPTASAEQRQRVMDHPEHSPVGWDDTLGLSGAIGMGAAGLAASSGKAEAKSSSSLRTDSARLRSGGGRFNTKTQHIAPDGTMMKRDPTTGRIIGKSD